MNGDKCNNTLDLGDEHVVHLFSEFITEKMRSNQISQKKLEDRVSFSAKKIQRYIHGEMPSKIGLDTYIQFLKALETTDEDFQKFVAKHQQDDAAFNSDSSDLQPSEPTQRRPHFFVYLALWLIPLILLITFLLWPSQATYYERGVTAKEQKQHAKAIDLLRMAIEKDSKNADAYYELADIYAELTDNSSAIENYRKGIAEDTKFSIRAYNNLALLLLSQHDVNNTLLLLDRAQQNIVTPIEKERWAQSGIIKKNQAWAYWKSGLNNKAMKLIIQAQELLGPAQILDQYPEVFCLHALIVKHIGDPAQAEQLCINRFEAYQAKQQTGAFGNTIKPIHGMTYELYLLVLKQHGNK